MFKLNKSLVLNFMSWYPPYLGAGVRVLRDKKDPHIYHVSMKQRWFNTNYVGVHFGGSLYSMCDPFFMLILMTKLGRDYIVWDKAATIQFKKPGTGRVRVTFEITDEKVAEIRDAVAKEGKLEPLFTAQIYNESGEVVAIVEKRLWVKRRS